MCQLYLSIKNAEVGGNADLIGLLQELRESGT